MANFGGTAPRPADDEDDEVMDLTGAAAVAVQSAKRKAPSCSMRPLAQCAPLALGRRPVGRSPHTS
jgi:hypothetical protein